MPSSILQMFNSTPLSISSFQAPVKLLYSKFSNKILEITVASKLEPLVALLYEIHL